MGFIEGWPHLRGGLYEGFHCIAGENDMHNKLSEAYVT